MTMPNKLFSALRANRRLRVGVAAIMAILWLNALLAWRDQVEVQRASYRSAAHRFERMRAESNHKEWLPRADAADRALKSARGSFWRGDTLGLAQAAFQDWLDRELVRLKAGNPVVKLAIIERGTDENSSLPGGAKPLRASVEFNFDPAILTPLLADLAASQQRMVVEAMSVKRQPPRVQLTVASFAFVAPPAEGKP